MFNLLKLLLRKNKKEEKDSFDKLYGFILKYGIDKKK